MCECCHKKDCMCKRCHKKVYMREHCHKKVCMCEGCHKKVYMCEGCHKKVYMCEGYHKKVNMCEGCVRPGSRCLRCEHAATRHWSIRAKQADILFVTDMSPPPRPPMITPPPPHPSLCNLLTRSSHVSSPLSPSLSPAQQMITFTFSSPLSRSPSLSFTYLCLLSLTDFSNPCCTYQISIASFCFPLHHEWRFITNDQAHIYEEHSPS